MIDSVQGITDSWVNEILEQKKKIVNERMLKVVGHSFEEEVAMNRRFHRILTIHEGEKESIYFNDGSISGVRLVTFVNKPPFFSIQENASSCMAEILYY